MPPKENKIDFWGYLIIGFFLLLLSYAGYLSYKSIDWTVLTRLESQKLVLPTPIIASPSASVATPAAKH
jgi:hypothetical protein